MEKQIFPSFIVGYASTQTYDDDGFPYTGEGHGRIGVVIKNPIVGSKYKFTLKIDGIADSQDFQDAVYSGGNLTNTGGVKQYWVLPAIRWNFDKLRNMNQPTTANATFSLSIDGGPVETKNVVIRIRSINDALIGYVYKGVDGKQSFNDATWGFSLYVNEDHPWIDKLLKEALDTEIVSQFDGYQSGDPNQVLKQAFAIWNMLQKRGFKYSSITESSNASDKVFSQNVRLFEDSINTSQANCLDGSALWISILRKIGIKSYLVLIPGHAFIVIDTDGNKGTAVMGLETTMMGVVDLKNAAADPKLLESLGHDAVNKVSLNSFLAAVESGNKTYAGVADKLTSRTDSSVTYTRDPRYSYIDIEDARKKRFFPISR